MSNDFDMALFAPEVVLPAQMSWGARYDGNTSGARALMLAILEDAMLCVERGRRRRHPHTRKLAAEAETWIRSDRREWLFSFASICDVLGIDAEAVRVRLLTNVEPTASTGPAVRAEADGPSTRSCAVAHLLPQRESTRGSIVAASAWRTGGGRGTGSGFGVRAQAEVV